MNAHEFLTQEISWKKVTAKVNKYFDRPYSSHYVHHVAKGYADNHKLYTVLEKLGVISLLAELKSGRVAV